MNRDSALSIKVGDEIRPKELWNQSERIHKLPNMVQVTELKTAQSQTGILIRVVCTSGEVRWLDAGWFHSPEVNHD